MSSKDQIKAFIATHQRRLQALRAAQMHPPQQNRDREIKEIEAEIQRLQAELDKPA